MTALSTNQRKVLEAVKQLDDGTGVTGVQAARFAGLPLRPTARAIGDLTRGGRLLVDADATTARYRVAVGTTEERWAASLTDTRLAADLRRLASDVRFHTGDERAALLREAARRIETKQGDPDGS